MNKRIILNTNSEYNNNIFYTFHSIILIYNISNICLLISLFYIVIYYVVPYVLFILLSLYIYTVPLCFKPLYFFFIISNLLFLFYVYFYIYYYMYIY